MKYHGWNGFNSKIKKKSTVLFLNKEKNGGLIEKNKIRF